MLNVLATRPTENGTKDFHQYVKMRLKIIIKIFVQDADMLLSKLLPTELHPAKIELLPYLMDSFGNSTRIDYGSGLICFPTNTDQNNIFQGHEASFMIFLLCLYEIGMFSADDNQAVVLRIFHRLIIILVIKY